MPNAQASSISPWLFARDRVGYAVGDIHGCADLLENMLAEIARDVRGSSVKDAVVIFLGDYVDRGPDSKRVLDILAGGLPRGFERRFLRGNHEQAMMYFLQNPGAARRWLEHGGMQTLISYGVEPPSLGASIETLGRAASELRAALGPEHLRLLSGLDRCAVFGDYLFVHAGIDPRRPFHEQADQDFYWIRERFLQSDIVFTHCVVHGHTPCSAPFRDGRRINIDTGAYQSGRLSAVRLEGASVHFLEASR